MDEQNVAMAVTETELTEVATKSNGGLLRNTLIGMGIAALIGGGIYIGKKVAKKRKAKKEEVESKFDTESVEVIEAVEIKDKKTSK